MFYLGLVVDHAPTLAFSLSKIVDIGRFINRLPLSAVRGGA